MHVSWPGLGCNAGTSDSRHSSMQLGTSKHNPGCRHNPLPSSAGSPGPTSAAAEWPRSAMRACCHSSAGVPSLPVLLLLPEASVLLPAELNCTSSGA